MKNDISPAMYKALLLARSGPVSCNQIRSVNTLEALLKRELIRTGKAECGSQTYELTGDGVMALAGFGVRFKR